MSPIVSKNAKVLLLGSMPGTQSLLKNEYYAHKNNAFWLILFNILKSKKTTSYKIKKNLVLRKKIGIWDVIKTCKRVGSLDSDICEEKVNNISGLLRRHKNIKAIFLNGRKTESLFKKHFGHLRVHREYLPSTSPAYPKIFNIKLKKWKRILDFL